MCFNMLNTGREKSKSRKLATSAVSGYTVHVQALKMLRKLLVSYGSVVSVRGTASV